MELDLISEVGVVIIACGLFGVLGYFLKQPLVFAYVIAGIAIGPYGLGIIQDTAFIDGIAKVGVVLLLFLIGLEMNIGKLKELGKVALIVGIGQVVFTGVFGYTIINIFGLPSIQEIYIAIALLFSSTVVAVKLMSDKKDTNSLYGQICIGVLIVQDVLAIIALLILSGFSGGSFDITALGMALLTGIVVAIVSTLIANKGLKYLYAKIATSHELLILFSITWCFIVALACYKMGFSKEIGAFIAGLNLANLPYTFEINSKTKILRDFFITIFFAGLGAGLVFTGIGQYILPIIVLSAFVLIGNPIIVMTIMGSLGYDKRTAFFTGLNIANISEFSLIVITMGKTLGHVTDEVYSAIGLIALITMVLSSYMITYNNTIYNKLKKYLGIFEFRKSKITQSQQKSLSNHIIVFGIGQIGEQIIEQILSFKEDYIAVDNDNNVMKKLISHNIHCMFGDASDEDVIENLAIKDAEIVISTIPSVETNHMLLEEIKSIPATKRPFTIVVANSAREGMEMLVKGADYIILKPYLSANHIHLLHKDLYNLEESHKHDKRLTRENIIKSTDNTHKSDREVAHILMNLNHLRLKEVKEKILKKNVSFLKNVTQNK